MFHPARMTRVLIGGHKSRMQDVIDVLHKEKAVHIDDFRDPTGTTELGTPLDAGERASELLVRARGLLNALDADDVQAREMTTHDPAALLGDAEAELGPVIHEAAELRTELSNLRAEVQHLQPFSGIDADLGVLQHLDSITPYMGTVRGDPRAALDAAGVNHETGLQGNAIIMAVAKADAAKADTVLSQFGFSGLAIPEADGTPAQRIAALGEQIQRSEERLARAEQRTAGHAEQWAPRLAALERHLAEVVDKTQAPLSFAVTETTFHVEGWIPLKRVNRVQNALAAKFGDKVYFESLGDAPVGHDDAHGHDHDDHHVDPKDEAPVHLDNKGLAKPYQFMLGLLGKPRYNEIDPTKLMLLFFPLFFGLMVGDVLVGLFIMLIGFYLKKNHIFGIGGPAVGRALAAGGFMAILVGAFIFGEALGIHFVVSDHALDEGEHSWEEIIYGSHIDESGHRVLNAEFPTEGFFHKEVSHHGDAGGHDAEHNDAADGGTHLVCDGGPYHEDADGHVVCDDAGNVTDHGMDTGNATAPHGNETGNMTTLAESTEEHGGGGITALFAPHGEVHLKAGPVQLGFYSKIHDIQALLAWCLVIAFVHLNLGFMIGYRNIAVGHGTTLAIQEKASWMIAQLGLIGAIIGGLVLGSTAIMAGGIGVFVLGIGLLWKGVEKALGAPGFVAILEFFGFFGNLLSYTRLAAIGASKAGMALAFSAIGFDVLGGGDVQSPVGWIIYILGMVLITALAMLSGGLQSLRLQFVEFFGKFFEGGGRAFQPFGRRSQ